MKNAVKSLLSLGVLVAGLGGAAPARAQDEGAPMAPPPAANPPPARNNYGGGGAGIGVGAVQWLSGLTGAQVVWDQAVFHLEGLFAFNSVDNGGDDRATFINVGAAAWYHLHRGASSDFSLGGGVGISNLSDDPGSAQALVLEPGAQVRVFLTPNVALHARVGLPVIFGDSGTGVGDERVSLFGQVTEAFGFSYFFR